MLAASRVNEKSVKAKLFGARRQPTRHRRNAIPMLLIPNAFAVVRTSKARSKPNRFAIAFEGNPDH
jgi:hypothetical protein